MSKNPANLPSIWRDSQSVDAVTLNDGANVFNIITPCFATRSPLGFVINELRYRDQIEPNQSTDQSIGLYLFSRSWVALKIMGKIIGIDMLSSMVKLC